MEQASTATPSKGDRAGERKGESKAQRTDGAGNEGCHRQQAEGGQRAGDKGKEELDGDLAGRFLGPAAPIATDLVGQPLEAGDEGSAVALRGHQGGDQWAQG